MAITVVHELMAQAKKAGRNYFMYMEDASQAFDNTANKKDGIPQSDNSIT